MEYLEEQRSIYKVSLLTESSIEGLISLEANKSDQFVEVHIIENAPKNKGESRKYVGVARTMMAFACKMSIDLGFEGYVAFLAKTKLVEHYKDTLGAELLFGRDRMAIFPDAAKKLLTLGYQ